MKKIIASTLCIITLVLLLASCGGEDANAFSFKTGEVIITPGDEAASIIEALGEPKEYSESPSCAFEGLDKQYVYGNFIVNTYQKGDKDYILSVALRNDNVGTMEGISVGDSKLDVAGIYSGGKTEDGMTVYTKGNTQLEFVFTSDNKVKSITYQLITD